MKVEKNMAGKIIITKKDSVIRYGYFMDGVPVELYCEMKKQGICVGNVYAARVERVADGIGGAFLEVGQKEKCFFRLPKNGQLPVKLSSGHADKLCGGDIILVQITKDAVKTKLPMAEGNVSLSGQYFVLTLGEKRHGVSKKIRSTVERERLLAIVDKYKAGEYGIVVRTKAEGISEEELKKELMILINRYQTLMKRAIYAEARSLLYQEPPFYITFARELSEAQLDEIVTDSSEIYEELCQYYRNVGLYGTGEIEKTFDGNPWKITLYADDYPLEKLYRFEHFYENALQKKVWLSSGGSLVIEPTEAMVVIDVNSGSIIKKKKHGDKIFFELNREAATEIVRQLRLRNLSGIILIDFINMEAKEQKKELLTFLSEECKKDRVNCQVIDMTALGLVEMIRSKKQKPLYEQLQDVKDFVKG